MYLNPQMFARMIQREREGERERERGRVRWKYIHGYTQIMYTCFGLSIHAYEARTDCVYMHTEHVQTVYIYMDTHRLYIHALD